MQFVEKSIIRGMHDRKEIDYVNLIIKTISPQRGEKGLLMK